MIGSDLSLNVTEITKSMGAVSDDKSRLMLYTAASGKWGSGINGDNTYWVSRNGHLVTWNAIGSGAQSVIVPVCNYRYYAQLITPGGVTGLLVKAKVPSVNVAGLDDSILWQLSGVFYEG